MKDSDKLKLAIWAVITAATNGDDARFSGEAKVEVIRYLCDRLETVEFVEKRAAEENKKEG